MNKNEPIMVPALLHSMENDQHDHKQPKQMVEFIRYEGENKAIVKTKDGITCSAIYNPWLGWMADDKYGIIKD